MSEEFVQYETLDDGSIARIMLNRPEARNAQNRGMLVELDEAFRRAEADDTVRVVILGGMGPMFSAGHDMGSKVAMAEWSGDNPHPTRLIDGGTRSGAEQRTLQEWHYYFDNTRRWRNLRKITIAQVHGTVFAAGLMLMWACDLIVAADDASFADVVGTRLGMCGVEYFAHPWEFGPRRTKELMLTGGGDADEDDEPDVEAPPPPKPNEPNVPEMLLSFSSRPPVTALTPLSLEMLVTVDPAKVASPGVGLRVLRENAVPACGRVPVPPPKRNLVGPPVPAAAVSVTLMSVPTP